MNKSDPCLCSTYSNSNLLITELLFECGNIVTNVYGTLLAFGYPNPYHTTFHFIVPLYEYDQLEYILCSVIYIYDQQLKRFSNEKRFPCFSGLQSNPIITQ